MASRRFSQTGHARLPSIPMSGGIRGTRRVALGFAALLAIAWVAMALTSQLLRGGGATQATPEMDARALRGPVSASHEDATANRPSLLTSALAKVQGTAQSLVGLERSGLTQRRLSADALQEVLPLLGKAEARLIAIYQLISDGRTREALAKADALVRDHPNFHLAHLVHGDLLSLQTRPLRQLGDVPDTKAEAAASQLAVLRDESSRRLRALTERPPEGSIPTQFLTLSPQSRHAIAIDASRSRLYLFENLASEASSSERERLPRLRLVGDYYISVGLSGIEKTVEGDKRTPLGVYYITSNLNPSNLPDLYGVGALPINYPNALDAQRGKTGSGIWLHGTPSDQFVRAPQASDGCVVLSNPDLERLLSTVQIRTTPVVIAPELHWVKPDALKTDREQFEAALEDWRHAKSQGDLNRLKDFYSERFQNQGRDLAQWWPRMEDEVRGTGVRELQLKDLSLLRWRDREETMVVTFGEVAAGNTRGMTKRQYWMRERDQWKIFFEGTI